MTLLDQWHDIKTHPVPPLTFHQHDGEDGVWLSQPNLIAWVRVPPNDSFSEPKEMMFMAQYFVPSDYQVYRAVHEYLESAKAGEAIFDPDFAGGWSLHVDGGHVDPSCILAWRQIAPFEH